MAIIAAVRAETPDLLASTCGLPGALHGPVGRQLPSVVGAQPCRLGRVWAKGPGDPDLAPTCPALLFLAGPGVRFRVTVVSGPHVQGFRGPVRRVGQAASLPRASYPQWACPLGLRRGLQEHAASPSCAGRHPGRCAFGAGTWRSPGPSPAACPLPPRVWSVRYNHSHDQLVLTGSSDSRVTLSNMVSISSEPFGHLVDDDDLSDPEERRPEEK